MATKSKTTIFSIKVAFKVIQQGLLRRVCMQNMKVMSLIL